MSARMPILVAVLLGGLCHSVDASEPDVEAVLARWAEASRQGPRLSAAILKTRYGAVHSAHELDAATVLLGPVDAKMLLERFNWSGTTSPEGVVTLIAEPRDTVEQLFYDRLKITIDAATSLPASIRFVGADGTPRPVVIQQRRPRPEPMVLPVAAAEDDRPGAPVVHTAAFVPMMPDERGVAAEGVDVADILRRWERYRQRKGVRAVGYRASFQTVEGRTTVHAEGTTFASGAGRLQSRRLEALRSASLRSTTAAGERPPVESRTAIAWMFELPADELLNRYEWKVVAADPGTVVLEAKPHGEASVDLRYRFQLSIEPAAGSWLPDGGADRPRGTDVPSLLPPTVPATATGPIDATVR
ncbi:hypothetical protein [Maioricimonas sp. JC845]|uniref:hypothetical protein n=1 Tax=Maioricimonas sp. JC845 TaxID=3232138 RepID=UPI0034582BEE